MSGLAWPGFCQTMQENLIMGRARAGEEFVKPYKRT